MGDTVDGTSELGEMRTCYPVSASSVTFYVRRSNNAQLTFLSAPNYDADLCKISLGMRGNVASYILGRGNLILKEHSTPRILSEDEWRGFWVTWHRRNLRVGRVGEATPFMTVELDYLLQIKYIMPSACGSLEGSQWRFILSPVLPKTVSKSVSGGEPSWVPLGEGLPIDAVIGGHENEPLYIIRAPHNGSVAPGKYIRSEGSAYVAWGRFAHRKQEFDVLVGYNFKWVATSGDNIPPNALPGGYAEYTHETLYIGRAYVDDHLIVGKVQPSYRLMYLPYKGKEVEKSEYEILVTETVQDPHGLSINRRFTRSLPGLFLGSRQVCPGPAELDPGFALPMPRYRFGYGYGGGGQLFGSAGHPNVAMPCAGFNVAANVGAQPQLFGVQVQQQNVGAQQNNGVQVPQQNVGTLSFGAQPQNIGAQPQNVGAQPQNVGAQPQNSGAQVPQQNVGTLSFGAQPQNVGAQPQNSGAQVPQQHFGGLTFGAQPQNFGAPSRVFGGQPHNAVVRQFNSVPQQRFGAQSSFGGCAAHPAGSEAPRFQFGVQPRNEEVQHPNEEAPRLGHVTQANNETQATASVSNQPNVNRAQFNFGVQQANVQPQAPSVDRQSGIFGAAQQPGISGRPPYSDEQQPGVSGQRLDFYQQDDSLEQYLYLPIPALPPLLPIPPSVALAPFPAFAVGPPNVLVRRSSIEAQQPNNGGGQLHQAQRPSAGVERRPNINDEVDILRPNLDAE